MSITYGSQMRDVYDRKRFGAQFQRGIVSATYYSINSHIGGVKHEQIK
jgi:hypothetical protein